jgi:endonuclease/exonuclease/phosphatase family metal-dependent hydrolase
VALGAVVRELAPDIAIIQEGPRRLRWRQKAVTLARRTGMLLAGGGLPSLGNLVLTTMRVGVRGVDCVQFPLTPGRHLRGAVLVRCVVGRTWFVVAGSHLSTDATERPSQAELLKHRLTRLDAPVLFGGDLNENSGGAAWRTIADGLVDVAEAALLAHLATFPSVGPTDRIDAVFVDPRWQVLGYQVVRTPATLAASDHLPVVADLLLPA